MKTSKFTEAQSESTGSTRSRFYKEMDLQLRNKTPKPRVRAKLRDDRKTASRLTPHASTRPGRWILCMINWRQAGSCGS